MKKLLLLLLCVSPAFGMQSSRIKIINNTGVEVLVNWCRFPRDNIISDNEKEDWTDFASYLRKWSCYHILPDKSGSTYVNLSSSLLYLTVTFGNRPPKRLPLNRSSLFLHEFYSAFD